MVIFCSGGHINPAVTLALTICRALEPLLSLCYIGSQLIGGIVGAALARVWFHISLSYFQNYILCRGQLGSWLHGKLSARHTGLKKVPITRNISVRVEIEIGRERRQKFVASLCCFGNLNLPTLVSHPFSLGWTFFRAITWDFSTRSTGLKLLHLIASSVFQIFYQKAGLEFQSRLEISM